MTVPSPDVSSGEVDSAGAADFNFDFGDSAPVETETGPQTTETKDNPAWAEYLNDIPDAFQPKIREAFSRWDQGVNSRFQQKAQEFQQLQERYAPYNEFIEQGIAPQQLSAAQYLLQAINTDPKGFYQQLGEHLGITAEQAQEVVEGEQFDAATGELTDPQVAALARQQQELAEQQAQFQEYIAQQAQAEEEQRIDAEVSAEIQSFQTQYNIPPVVMNEIIREAVLLGQSNPDVTIMQAAQSWNARQKALYAQRPTNNAPGVVPVGGGDPMTPRKGYADMSKDEFTNDTVAALKEII